MPGDLHKPTYSERSGAEGEIIVYAVGADVQPFMMPEEVRDLQDRLKDPFFRARLAGYTATQVCFDEHIGSKSTVERRDVRFIAETAAINFFALTQAAESEAGWPDGITSPEYIELSRREMEAEAYRSSDG